MKIGFAALLLATAAAADEPEPPDDTSSAPDMSTEGADRIGEEAEPGPSFEPPGLHLGSLVLSGDLSQKYRFRTTSRESDQDLYGYLNLDGRLPHEGAKGARPYSSLNFNFQGSYNLDIDSFRGSGDPQGSFIPFSDITNTYQERLQGYIYSAYVELEELRSFELARAGRQQIYREYGILFDGGRVRTERWNTLALEVYGGLPAHLHESSPRGDAFGGAGVDSALLPGLVVGADYFYIRDERDRGLPDSDEHVYLARGTYRANEEWRVDASASWVDTRDRLQQVIASYNSIDWGLAGTLRAARQNGVADFQSSEISPYVFIEGSYAPYYQFTLDLRQPIGDTFGAGGGVDVRQLEDESDDRLYNHSFRNFYLQADAAELWPGSRLTVRGDLWDTVGGDDIHSVGFEVDQKVGELLRARAGTSFALYRIDLFTGKERERDRLYYLRLRWNVARGLEVDTDYHYERDSVTEYHTLIVGIRKWF